MSPLITLPKPIEGKNALLLWGQGTKPEELQVAVNDIKETLKPASLSLENVERLSLSGHSSSTFDSVVSNVIAPYEVIHTIDVLAEVLRILKPSGTLYVRVKPDESVEKLLTNLRLSGFVSVGETINDGPAGKLLSGDKPNFEVGSSAKLSFGNASAQQSVWTLSDDLMDDDVGLVDESELLNEEDLVAPSEASLRVCGTTGQRKACKNCACGLAEELESEVTKKTSAAPKAATSACGSCYLGDAFRCASCPYLGMPAFKPGEKIQIPTGQLKPDV